MAGMASLFMAIDLHCHLQDMERQSRASTPEYDEVTYYVNMDSTEWVEQHMIRRVYIELKLECTRNRSRDVGKAKDDWLCLYFRESFSSKLRLTNHHVAGCAYVPVDSNGSRWELLIYFNLKIAKQGKNLKITLQRGDGEVWDNLHDNAVWFDLNPELKDIFLPFPQGENAGAPVYGAHTRDLEGLPSPSPKIMATP